ncbi:hypothetical protein GGS20DRAFT_311066 [Poronia punctata]|nr:hypothetical protein GGS20DRAFT_311066 [Poronia punctata]
MAGLPPSALSPYLGLPIQTPPPGVTPNFVDPDSTAYQVYITAGICTTLIVVFSLARFLSKFYALYKTHLADDVVFVVGMVFSLAFIAMTIACLSGSVFGRHAWNVLLGGFTKSQLILSLLVEILGPQALSFVKLSVFVLYLRIFGVKRWMRIVSIAGIVAVAAFHLAMSIVFAVSCAPTTGSSQLDFLAAFVSGACNRTRSVVVIQGVGAVFIDTFLLLFPLPAVWGLQMPVKRKLAISSMFLVGLSACISSIIGLYYRTQYYAAGDDNIRLVVPLWATSMAEMAAGVIVCCMPATAALFKRVKRLNIPCFSTRKEKSHSGILLSSSHTNIVPYNQESAIGSNPIYCYPYPPDRHMAWVDAQMDDQPLRPLGPQGNNIAKSTDVEVSWETHPENQGLGSSK